VYIQARDVIYKDYCHCDDYDNRIPSCWVTEDMTSYDSDWEDFEWSNGDVGWKACELSKLAIPGSSE
jgi:hypothetical protein